MIKNIVCVLLVATIATIVFADRGIEEDILSRCKHVQCKDVTDLRLEAKIRQCIKTTCNSKYLKTKNLAKECEKDCKQEVISQPESVPDGEPVKILNYDWLD